MVITEALTTEVIGNGGKLTALKYKIRNTDEIATVELDGIFVQIGLLPTTDFLKDTVQLINRGEIEINARDRSPLRVFYASNC